MKSKRGVTFSIIMVAIVIMLIVISSASFIGSKAISTANFEEYKSELQRVSDDVNEYYLKNGYLPTTEENIDYDKLDELLKNAISRNNDSNSIFFVVSISDLDDSTLKNGKGSIETKDVYIVSEKTQNIYYLNGFKYNGTIYYCI